MADTSQTFYAIARYLNVRTAYTPRFMSSGHKLVFLTDITGLPQVWQVGIDSEGEEILWPDQLTFEADRVAGVMCSPAHGDSRIIYARDVGGNENAQLFLLDTEGASEIPLTAGYENAMHTPGDWSHDGTHILFAANRRHPDLFDLYLQPLDGEARIVWQNDTPGFLFDMVFAPDGKHAVVSRMSSSFSNELFEIDLAAGSARLISPQTEAARYDSLCYTPDGRSLFVTTDLGSDFLYVAQLDMETLALEPAVTDEWDVEAAKPSPDGQRLAYVVNRDGVSVLHMLELDTGQIRTAPSLGDAPGLVVSMFSLDIAFSPDSSQLAFAYTSATRTADIYLWDLKADQVHAVTRSSHGGLPVESFIAPELIHYPTFDTDSQGRPRQIPAWFYRPAGQTGGPVPVIVVVHGGPEAQAVPNFLFYIHYFLQNGYAVLVPNVRGSTGYGKAYSHLDDVKKRMDSVADLAHAAHWLKTQPGIDGDRLVVYGASYGGFMVLSALTTYPDLWVAGVDIVGISSFVTFLENTSSYRRAHREVEYGSLERDREFLDQISPINHIGNIKVPLIVIHGANDPRVPVGETKQLVEALRARGIPVELIIFDDEGHGVIKLKNKLVAYPAIVDFLAEHLMP